MSKLPIIIFITTLIVVVYRDSFTDASNNELSFYVIAGMITAATLKYIIRGKK